MAAGFRHVFFTFSAGLRQVFGRAVRWPACATDRLHSWRSAAVRALSGELLLAAWNDGAAEHDLERDLLLLRLREASFGRALSGFSVCAQCAARLVFTLPVSTMLASLEGGLASEPIVWT